MHEKIEFCYLAYLHLDQKKVPLGTAHYAGTHWKKCAYRRMDQIARWKR